jgi:dolichol-phosphate mannosyltransferase
MSTVSVVVPVYHNSDTLPLLLARLDAVSRRLSADCAFIFVDDGSGDSSFEVLQRLALADPRVGIVKLSRNFGSNVAILAGLTHATGDCVVTISADLQDPPELIEEMVAAWRGGKDVVLAARRTRRDPWISSFFARTFNWLFRRLVFADFPKGGFDFMLLSRRVSEIIVSLREQNSYIFGQVMWVGFSRAVLYYDREERPGGRSLWTTFKKIKYFIDAFAAFSYLPLRLASALGIALAGVGFLYALVVIWSRLAGRIPISGWSSLTVVVLTTSGVQLAVVGLLGEYLWRTLDESRKRPPFIVEDLINVASPPRENPR